MGKIAKAPKQFAKQIQPSHIKTVGRKSSRPVSSHSVPEELTWQQAERLMNHPRRKHVGKGGYGWVSKVPFRGRLCAMKIGFKKRDETGETGEEMLLREIDLTIQATGARASPHIVRVVAYHKGSDEHGTRPLMLLEWAPNGDLNSMWVEETTVVPRIVSMFEGLEDIHRNGVCHFDLKPENLLVAKDQSVRIADFGLAQTTAAAAKVIGSETVGSPGYEAPECHLKSWENRRLGKHCTKIDVFAGGMTAAALLVSTTPAQADHAIIQAALDKAEKEPHVLDLRKDLRVADPGLRRFFLRTLNPDPSKRATPREAIRLIKAARVAKIARK
jgi:serine/threonine protein kinase